MLFGLLALATMAYVFTWTRQDWQGRGVPGRRHGRRPKPTVAAACRNLSSALSPTSSDRLGIGSFAGEGDTRLPRLLTDRVIQKSRNAVTRCRSSEEVQQHDVKGRDRLGAEL